MKIVPFLIITMFVALASYVLGYKNGGHDLIHLDHGLIGKISVYHIEYCDGKENPIECYKSNEEYNAQTALISHVLYRQNVSILSKYIFPEFFRLYDGAIEHIINYAVESKMKFDCEIFKELPSLQKEKTACEAYTLKVNELLALHSNKSLKGTP